MQSSQAENASLHFSSIQRIDGRGRFNYNSWSISFTLIHTSSLVRQECVLTGAAGPAWYNHAGQRLA